MKRSLAALAGVICICIFMVGVAHAQVVSSYENPIIAPQEKPLAGYEGGFYLRSADDAFRLQIYSRLQFQYFYQDIRQTASVDTSTFRVRRARFVLLGTLFRNFDFTVFANHGTNTTAATAATNGNVNLWWADMTARVVPQFNITMGVLTLPMDRQGENSSGKYAFVEQPITATQADGIQKKTIERQALGMPLTLGVRLWGDISRFHYIVGVGNGDAQNIYNVTRQPAYGARVWVDILGKPGYVESDIAHSVTPQFAIGAGTTFEGQNVAGLTFDNGTAANINWSWTSSGDMIFQWQGFTLLAEAYLRRLKVSTGNFTLDDFGYYGQVGYFVIPKKLEIVGRAAQIFREGANNNAYEFAGGLNWFIQGNNVKWQFDTSRLIDFDLNEGTGGTATMRYRTMLTFQI